MTSRVDPVAVLRRVGDVAAEPVKRGLAGLGRRRLEAAGLQPVLRGLLALDVAAALVVADRDRDVEVAVLEQPLEVEVVLLLGAGLRGGAVELAEGLRRELVAGHPPALPEEPDRLARLAAERAVAAVADHLEPEVDERLLDGLDRRPVVGGAQDALPPAIFASCGTFANRGFESVTGSFSSA